MMHWKFSGCKSEINVRFLALFGKSYVLILLPRRASFPLSHTLPDINYLTPWYCSTQIGKLINYQIHNSMHILTFVLMMATKAAYTCVNDSDAAWACMMERVSRPLPRMMLCLNSSRTIEAILATLTLLIRPWIAFFNTSQAMRWYAGL